jgi:hypothetical protein
MTMTAHNITTSLGSAFEQTMSSDTPPRNLVWVTVGKTQHPAFLLDSGEQGNLVRWTSNQKTEWIDSDDIQLE